MIPLSLWSNLLPIVMRVTPLSPRGKCELLQTRGLFSPLRIHPLSGNVKSSMSAKLTFIGATFSLFFTATLAAQAVNYQFSGAKTFTYSTPFNYGTERYDDVTVDEDGTSYLVGSSNGPLENDYPSTRWKAFVHKVDANGNVLREKVFKLSGLDLSGARILNLDASSLLVVLQEGTIWTHYRIWRLSKDTLEPLWAQDWRFPYFQPGASYELSFASNRNGSFAICWRVLGWEQSTANSFVQYYNASGALQWQDTLGFQYAGTGMTSARSRDSELSHALCFAPNGDLIVGGSSPSPAVPKIARYSANGMKLFEIAMPNLNPGPISTITVDDEGNAYAVNLVGSNSARKILLTKVSPSGAIIGSPVQLDRFNTDYSTYHFYSLAFIHGHVVLLEDTVSGIGASAPYYHVFSKDLAPLQSAGASFVSSNTQPYTISKNGFFAAGGADRNGNAVRILRTFEQAPPNTVPTPDGIPSAIDVQPPNIAPTSPLTTRRSKYVLTIKLTDDTGTASLRVRLKAPGLKKYGRWIKVNLIDSGLVQDLAARLPLRLKRTGKWQVQVQAFDASNNASPLRTITIRRQ